MQKKMLAASVAALCLVPDLQAQTVLEEVLVTATRLPRVVQDVPGTISLISSEQIEAQLANDIKDIVRYEPGVSVNTSARGGDSGFTIRGIGGSRVLTIVDGIRSSDFLQAGPAAYGNDNFETADIKSVEIIRGPASVIYGADALAGAVIITTKSAADYLGEQSRFTGLSMQHSSIDEQLSSTLMHAQQFDSLGVVAQYTHREREERKNDGTAFNNGEDLSTDKLLLKAEWALSDVQRVDFVAEIQREENDLELLSDEQSSSVFDSFGVDETDKSRFSLGHHWQLETAWADHVRSQFYWQQTEQLQQTTQQRLSFSFQFPGAAERITDFEFNQEIFGAEFNFAKALKAGNIAHSLVYGLSYDVTATERPRNRCEVFAMTGQKTCAIAPYPGGAPEVFPNKTFPDTDTTRAGLYLQDEMVIGNSGLTIIPALRYDYYAMDADAQGVVPTGVPLQDISENELSLNVGLIYDLTDTTALYYQYAEGFRPPNYDEANQSFTNYGHFYRLEPNPNLKPETSVSHELGIKMSADLYQLTLSVYQNDYEDFIESRRVGRSPEGLSLFQDTNVGEVTVEGVEFTALRKLGDNWLLRAGAAYADGEDKIDNVPLDSVEPLHGFVAVAYKQERWNLEAIYSAYKGKSASDLTDPENQVEASGYATLDLLGKIKLSENISLRAGIFNLLDREYSSWNALDGVGPDETDDLQRARAHGISWRIGVDLSI
jgi:hemoglobin/transferrin/lactoferrin receptor protein